MSQSTDTVPAAITAIEKPVTSMSLNSTMLFTFLMGAYTFVYFGTLYAYLTRKAGQRRLIVAAITLLHLLSVLQLGIQWWILNWLFIDNGETRDNIFSAIYDVPEFLAVINNVCVQSIIVLADGLLLWRCINVWDKSARVMALPLLLWVTEIGLALSSITIQGVNGSVLVSQKLSLISNAVVSAAYFLSAATSLVTTALIAYRIYSASSQDGSSTQRFRQVIDIVVQSSAFYSLALLAMGIIGVLPGSNSLFDLTLEALNNYVPSLAFAITGLAPTVMVARVALLATDSTHPSTTSPISGLQFQFQETKRSSRHNEIQAPGVIEDNFLIDNGSHSAHEGEKDMV